jgi:hypothetical protein
MEKYVHSLFARFSASLTVIALGLSSAQEQ